jgi:uncharacterized protein (TIGR02147 family)
METSPTVIADIKDFRLYLQLEFSSRRKRNESYSLRRFAKTLGVSPSALSAMFSGKRPISDRMRERLGFKLGLRPQDLEKFDCRPHGNRKAATPRQEPTADFRQISIDVFQVISEPHHYALLELMKTRSFHWEQKWIAKRLNLSPVDVRAAIERLEKVGLLRRDPTGTLADSTGGFSTDIREGLSNEAQRRFQQASLRQAEKSINEISPNLRDNTSITFAVNSKDIPRAKEMIKTFRRKVCRELESNPQLDEVYQLTIAFTPISRVTEEQK